MRAAMLLAVFISVTHEDMSEAYRLGAVIHVIQELHVCKQAIDNDGSEYT
jgi:ABC-type proline/glycine betaine transport system ATPase subunit